MYPGESVLPDDHLIRVYDWILVDGYPFRSPYYGSVAAVKKDISKKFKREIKELRWCNRTFRSRKRG